MKHLPYMPLAVLILLAAMLCGCVNLDKAIRHEQDQEFAENVAKALSTPVCRNALETSVLELMPIAAAKVVKGNWKALTVTLGALLAAGERVARERMVRRKAGKV